MSLVVSSRQQQASPERPLKVMKERLFRKKTSALNKRASPERPLKVMKERLFRKKTSALNKQASPERPLKVMKERLFRKKTSALNKREQPFSDLLATPERPLKVMKERLFQKKTSALNKRANPVTLRKMDKELFQKKTSALNMKNHKLVACTVPMKSESHKRKRVTNESLYINDSAKFAVMKRASEVQDNLAPEFPSMIKHMLPSHVTGGFWLGLPRQFCVDHLPKRDATIVLEDEAGENYETKYLVEKVGLSGGWRGFSVAHNLLEGDVLVFHLVRPTKFKVYIVRKNNYDETNGAVNLLKSDACKKQKKFFIDVVQSESVRAREMEKQDASNCKDKAQKITVSVSGTHLGTISDQFVNGSEDYGFELEDGIRVSESAPDFKDVKSFDDFDIIVDGLVLSPELSKHLQKKYYELCCSQKSFLHDSLILGLNCKLIAGIISETINIADAIRASKITMPLHHFIIWKNTLKSFETLGMNVGFLLGRLDLLLSLAEKSERHEEAIRKRSKAEEERKALETKLLQVNCGILGLDKEIEALNLTASSIKTKFQEVATAPW